MGIKPAQGKFNVALKSIFGNTDYVHLIHDDQIIATTTNVALKPIFGNIHNVHLIHHDLIIATTTMRELIQTVLYVMEAISAAGLTLNTNNCTFARNKTHFSSMIFSADGI